ncbi:hypothetical protein ERJ75_000573200 [Trypanosoma vivax]|nr:hypothetical protein ERJ75_000573200 [Trypanosoma vivax]
MPSLCVVFLAGPSESYPPRSQVASFLRREACRRASATPFCSAGPPSRCSVPPFSRQRSRVAPSGPRCVGPLRASAHLLPITLRPSRPAVYGGSRPPDCLRRFAVGQVRGQPAGADAPASPGVPVPSACRLVKERADSERDTLFPMRRRCARTAPSALAVPDRGLLSVALDCPRSNRSWPASPAAGPRRDAWRARARSVAMTGCARARKAHSCAPGRAAACATPTVVATAGSQGSGPGRGNPRTQGGPARERPRRTECSGNRGQGQKRSSSAAKARRTRRESARRTGRRTTEETKERERRHSARETSQRKKKESNATRPGRGKHDPDKVDAKRPAPGGR